MDLGFNGDLAAVAGVAATLTKMVIFPGVQARRRVDADKNGELDDEATGAYLVHPGLHAPIALALVAVGAVVFAVAAGLPVFPVLSAAVSGFAGARATHESVQSART